jgi:hypothetical protein
MKLTTEPTKDARCEVCGADCRPQHVVRLRDTHVLPFPINLQAALLEAMVCPSPICGLVAQLKLRTAALEMVVGKLSRSATEDERAGRTIPPEEARTGFEEWLEKQIPWECRRERMTHEARRCAARRLAAMLPYAPPVYMRNGARPFASPSANGSGEDWSG